MSSKPSMSPEQKQTATRFPKSLYLWILAVLGLSLTCVVLTICILVTSQVALRIALAPTPAPPASQTPTVVPTSTSTASRLSTSFLTPTSNLSATPTKSATDGRIATISPTGSRSSRPSPTGTKTPTLAPAPIPTAFNVTFKFDSGVSQKERDIIQQGISFAQSRLGDTGSITILAYSNLDALAAEADQLINRSEASTGSRNFREMFSAGKWLANGGSGAISIWISERWLRLSAAYKQKTLVHEYFHNVQASLAKKGVTSTGPIWLYEGAADIVAFTAVAETGAYTFDQIHTDKVTQSRGMQSPLSSIVTLQDTQIEDTEVPYQLGYLAVEYLISPFGTKQLGVLKGYWQAQGSGSTWQDAFSSTFGMSVDSFYYRFEEYRRVQFPPFCGTVGIPLAQATPAPLNLYFVRQLPPGNMPRSEMSWSDPPNIPYVFCATGTKLPWLSTSAYRFPSRYAGWIGCGANCITIYMRPSDPAGQYTFAIDLPDGNRIQAHFEHKVPSATTPKP